MASHQRTRLKIGTALLCGVFVFLASACCHAGELVASEGLIYTPWEAKAADGSVSVPATAVPEPFQPTLIQSSAEPTSMILMAAYQQPVANADTDQIAVPEVAPPTSIADTPQMSQMVAEPQPEPLLDGTMMEQGPVYSYSDAYPDTGFGAPCYGRKHNTCGDGLCGTSACGTCGVDVCDPCGSSCYVPLWVRIQEAWHRNNCSSLVDHMSVYVGVEGFKGQPDMAANANFGFHEGLNFSGIADGCLGIGYQAGVTAVQSSLSGHQAEFTEHTRQRNQVFYTLGLFQRAPQGGLQWALAYDGLQDNYYSNFSLGQLRTEISIAKPCWGECGFLGAFHVKSDRVEFENTPGVFTMHGVEPHDYFTAFARKYYGNGGHGRFYAGATNTGNALLGADCYIPINDSWAVNNTFAYMIPKHGPGTLARHDESWNLSISLVYTCGRKARNAQAQYAPMLNVADNGTLIPNIH